MSEISSLPVISVIIPMYNVESEITTNVNRLIKILENCGDSWELILVNDGSTDNTLQVITQNFIKDIGRDKKIKIISYENNKGRGYALRKGFESAKGEYIVTIEADLNYGPEIVLQMVNELKSNGIEMVIASPYLKGGRLKNVPIMRAFLSKYGNKILSLATHKGLTTISGMTRAYKRKVIESIDLESNDKEIHLEIVSKAKALGYEIGEIPAVLSWTKKSKTSSFKPIKFIFSHLLFSLNEYPLLFLGGLGFIIFILGTLIGFYALFLSITGTGVGGRPMILGSVLLILFGTQICIFSFLANQNTDLRKKLIRIEEKLLHNAKETK